MTTFDRRTLLKGFGAATLAAGSIGRAKAWFASPDLLPATATEDALVVVFLRGAMDGLSLLPPSGSSPDRGFYEQYRDRTRVPSSGAGAGLALSNTPNWILHPRASGLRDLYNSQHLAFVVAAGQAAPLPVIRSHFDAQANLEFGFGGGTGNSVGWLTRHLVSGGLPANVPLPAVSMGSITAASLLGSSDAITMGGGNDFRLNSFHWSWGENNPDIPALVGAVRRMNALWNGNTQLEVAGAETLGSLALLRNIDFAGYAPSGGANYNPDPEHNPTGDFGRQLRDIACLIKQGIGVRAATIDLGNWDTHVGQGNPTQGYDWFGNQVQILSDGLSAFYTDLASGTTNLMNRVSVLVVSEFGRRAIENSDGGTDHGYGNVMLALGGRVNGGIVYGNYPGLENLYENTDVAVTTDYRQVISEALIRRMGNPNIYHVFPGYSGYTPLGLFQGADLPPGHFDNVFASGFDGS